MCDLQRKSLLCIGIGLDWGAVLMGRLVRFMIAFSVIIVPTCRLVRGRSVSLRSILRGGKLRLGE